MLSFAGVTIQLDSIKAFFLQSPTTVVLELFALIGWIIVVRLLLFAGLSLLEEYKSSQASMHWHWILLAVDIPPLNIQTPKAVEQMFSHLAGALEHVDIEHKFVHGIKQRWFSFEIISIEGYIQFLVRTEAALRDLVEASIYAQYPEAEITEVEDYVDTLPSKFPNQTHEIWAADFALAEGDAYPLRTYREFEHSISKDTVLKDPMGTFLESFTRIGPGEQMWFQIIIEPTSNSWKHTCIDKVNELIGDTTKHRQIDNKIVDFLSSAPIKALEGVGDQIFGREASEPAPVEHSEPNKLKYLTPGQVKLVEAIELKMAKIGFKTKLRAIYLARKEVFQPNRGVQALVGAIQQFNIPSANSLVPKFGVNISYFFKKSRIRYRKNLLIKAYKKRKLRTGATPFILNIEAVSYTHLTLPTTPYV